MSGTNPFARFALAKSPSSAAAKSVKREPDRSPVAAASDAKKRKRKLESDDDALIPLKQEVHVQIQSETPEDKRLALLKQIIAARATTVTPIDEFGTQACVASDLSDVASPEERGRVERFQLLVAALLSSQTNDKITHAAMQRLHRHSRELAAAETAANLPSFLSIATIQATSEAQLDALLTPVGFHRRKAQQIKQIADRLRHRGDLPQSLDELETLPGIGPKIARVILLLAWGKADGLIVDTHVHRLAQRLHWVPYPSKTAEDTRKELEQWVPREHWSRFSLAVVGFGQTVCTATKPKCGSCPLAKTCPSAFLVNERARKPHDDGDAL